jgi:hypothetical protein
MGTLYRKELISRPEHQARSNDRGVRAMFEDRLLAKRLGPHIRDRTPLVRPDRTEMHELRADLLCCPSHVLCPTPLGTLKVGRLAVHDADEGDNHRCTPECGSEGELRGDVRWYGREQPCSEDAILNKGRVDFVG